MGYKQPSSGLPFKEMGSSPAKQDVKTFSGDSSKNKTSIKEFNEKTKVIGGKTYDKPKKEKDYTIDYSKLSSAELQALREKKGVPYKESPAKQTEEKGTEKVQRELEKVQLNTDGHPINPTAAQKEERAHFEKNSESARKKSTNRKIKEFLHGGEENLVKKEEIGDAKRARTKRRKEARHKNKLARINKPTRAERRKSKRENKSGELD